MPKVRRVVVVDASKYFDTSLWQAVAGAERLRVVGLARNSAQARWMVATCFPDLVLIDTSYGGLDGLAVIEDLHRSQPAVPLLAITTDASATVRQIVRAAGAIDCLPKSELVERLGPAVDACYAGRSNGQSLSLLLPNRRRLWQYLLSMGLGLVSGAVSVLLVISLALLVQLALPPSVVFFLNLVPLMVAAVLVGLAISWALGQGLPRLWPRRFGDRPAPAWQTLPLFSIGACLLQTILFSARW